MIIHPPLGRGGRSASVATPRRDRNEPPFLRGQAVATGQASGLVLLTEASPLRDSAGFTPASLCSATSRRTGTAESYCTWARRSEERRVRKRLVGPPHTRG